jgi:hypothetical protein
MIHVVKPKTGERVHDGAVGSAASALLPYRMAYVLPLVDADTHR